MADKTKKKKTKPTEYCPHCCYCDMEFHDGRTVEDMPQGPTYGGHPTWVCPKCKSEVGY